MRWWCWLLAAVMAGGCGADRVSISNAAASPGAVPVGSDAETVASIDAGAAAPGDAARPPPDGAVDAGCAATGTDSGDPTPLVRTVAVAAIPAGTTKLLGDPAAVFGVTADGMIWALDQGAASVRQLVAGGDSSRALSLTMAGGNLFWTDPAAGTLHRMAPDGSGGVVLASGLASPSQVTADDSRVYWLTAGDSLRGEGGGEIESLPLDATPGDPPQALATIGELSAVSSMAATAGSLFWTAYEVDATMYYASLVTAPVRTLLAGGTGTAVAGVAEPYGLVAVGSDVYFGYGRTSWTTVITRLSDQAVLSVLPIDVSLRGLVVAGDWLLVTGAGENQLQELYATPLDSPSGFVVVATDLGCPPVISPWGVTYVTGAGALVAFPAAQLSYVGFGVPAP